jgi:hypothetical protein
MLLVFVIIALALGWWVDRHHWQWVSERDNGLEQAAKSKVNFAEFKAKVAEEFANQTAKDYFRATGKWLFIPIDNDDNKPGGGSSATTNH